MNRLYEWILKITNFDKWWKLHCEKEYCSKCSDKSEGCKIDYLTGKCISPLVNAEIQ